jgi:hypothetical protein
VQAKQSDQGLLIAAGRLNADGEREVRASGPPVNVLDGDAFAEDLIRTGVGVMRAAMPLAYLDADFFAELVQS